MRWGRMHEGIDIAGSSGTPIAAAASGTVIVAGWSGGYGNLVVIDHGNGISTAYGHNSSLAVSVGQTVGQGAIIAGMGTTGHSTGVHCHFEVRVNGAAVDPLGYL
jgi:murein DD-endopeptidase MepM/ murein hydrolase activator NlpD